MTWDQGWSWTWWCVHKPPLQAGEEAQWGPTPPILVRRRQHSGPEHGAASHLRPLIKSRSQDGRNRKEGGTLSRSRRLPIPGQGRQTGARRDRLRNPQRQRHGDAGCSGASAPFLWRQLGTGAAAATTTGSAASLLTAGGSGRRGGLRGHGDARWAAGSYGRPEHPRPWLTPVARSWAGAGRCRRTGTTLETQTPGVLRLQAGRRGRGAAKREAAGRLLFPRCRMKPAWSGQVMARQAAWRCSGPSQTPGRGRLGFPTPLPPPSPTRSFPSLFSPRPSSSGIWAGPGTSRLQR